MGKKKKGGGAEKTAAKTDKKLSQKMKKNLELAGEDEISAIVAQIEKEEQRKKRVIEKIMSTPPSPRAYFTLVAHPEKDELILFGGEFYNGKETEMYNDLFIYNTTKGEWKFVKSPGGPAPRSAHQSLTIPAGKGEMWMFGGEFTTKSESQFYHYKDLWVLYLDSFNWEKIQANGGPSSRSGHRMVAVKRQLIIFGGYHDNLHDYKYFDDLHLFNLDTRIWSQIKPNGIGPAARSACQMVPTPDGKVLLWGGYSKVKQKKEIEQGVVHKDTFLLSPERGDASGIKWKWSIIKPGGVKPYPLSGVACTFFGARAFSFGGAADNETEEDIETVFYNQIHSLDLTNFIWSEISLSGKKKTGKSRRRRKDLSEDCKEEDMEDATEGDAKEEDDENCDYEMEDLTPEEQTIEDEDGFTLKIGKAPQVNALMGDDLVASGKVDVVHQPHPRINCGMAMKQSKLFLYGGIFEKNDITYTLSDLYSLDVQKLDEWKELIPCDLSSQLWLGSDSESDNDNEDSSSESDSENADSGDDEDDTKQCD